MVRSGTRFPGGACRTCEGQRCWVRGEMLTLCSLTPTSGLAAGRAMALGAPAALDMMPLVPNRQGALRLRQGQRGST